MKKTIFFLAAMLVAVTSIAQVQLEVNEYGKYAVRVDSSIPVETTAEPEAVKFVGYFDIAVLNPNEFISLENHRYVVRMTSIFEALKYETEYGIVYNSQDNQIVYSKNEHPEARVGSCLLIFALLSLLLMIITNIFIKEDRYIFKKLIITLTILSAVVGFFISFFWAMSAAILASFFVCMSSDYLSDKLYKVNIAAFYTCMVAYFVFMFIGM